MLALVKTLTRLGDRQHLVREKAALELEEFSFEYESAEMATSFIGMMYSSQRWEDRFGAILGSIALAKSAKDLASEFLWKNILEEKITVLIQD